MHYSPTCCLLQTWPSNYWVTAQTDISSDLKGLQMIKLTISLIICFLLQPWTAHLAVTFTIWYQQVRMWSWKHTFTDTHRKHWINSLLIYPVQTHTKKYLTQDIFTDSCKLSMKISLCMLLPTCVSWSCAGRHHPPVPWTCWPVPLSPRRHVNPTGPTSAPRDRQVKDKDRKIYITQKCPFSFQLYILSNILSSTFFM